MAKFKTWFERVDRDFNYYKDILLNFLNLDPQNGLSQNVDSMNRENLKQRLQGLGIFANLNPDIQAKVLSAIDSPQGATIGDLIRLISGRG